MRREKESNMGGGQEKEWWWFHRHRKKYIKIGELWACWEPFIRIHEIKQKGKQTKECSLKMSSLVPWNVSFSFFFPLVSAQCLTHKDPRSAKWRWVNKWQSNTPEETIRKSSRNSCERLTLTMKKDTTCPEAESLEEKNRFLHQSFLAERLIYGLPNASI